MKNTLFQRLNSFSVKTIVFVLGIAWMVSSCEKQIEGIDSYRVYDDKMIDELMLEEELTSFLAIVAKANIQVPYTLTDLYFVRTYQ